VVRRRGVAQNSALALSGDLAAKAGTMAAMIVAARGLSTAQFALLAAAMATATVLTAAFDLGSQTLLTRDGVSGPPARGALLRALAIARAPLFCAAVLVAAVVGSVSGHPLETFATLLLSVAGAAQLTLTGALRSAQDLRPEAVAKLSAGALMVFACGTCMLLAPRPAVVLLALAAANLLALAPMLRAARGAISAGPAQRPWTAFRRAAPLGAMALATLAYYRSGTIVLSLLSSSAQTARFAAASTVAWGLLSVGNAVTTGLLPRLAAARDDSDRAAVTRRALIWMSAMALALGGLVALAARPLLTLMFGARYGSGAGVLVLLAGATVLIAPAGVLGTALIAAGRVRPVALQVVVSLLVNLLVLAALVPRLGADGAAVATLICELAGLALLARAAWRSLPGVAARPRHSQPAGVFLMKAGR
jgi:O-antigen/teichoic acid export membrane protein